GLMTGALLGGLLGGANIVQTVDLMIEGAEGIIPPVLRILSAGVLAGILIESGAADKLAKFTVSTFGQKRALLALAIATMLLTAVWVFSRGAVKPCAAHSFGICFNGGFSPLAIFVRVSGGSEWGNCNPAHPDPIACSDAFDVPLI